MKLIQIAVTVLLLTASASHAAAQTNATSAPVWESWESMSNHWARVATADTTKAAESGDVSAQYYLAIAYEAGFGVQMDPRAAFKWIKPVAEKGSPSAQRKIGWMLQNGLGVEADLPQAIEWYRKSAEQGDMQAQINLALTFADATPHDYNSAEKWMRKAADHGWPKGQWALGHLLENEFTSQGSQIANFPEAAEWYKKAAEQGYLDAQLELANLYYYGKLGDDKRTNAIPWALKAAAQGNAEAKGMVAQLKAAHPDSELLKTVDLIATIRESAAAGDIKAQMELSQRYAIGEGVAKDPVKAFNWMQKAAAQDPAKGSIPTDAQCHLAMMYEHGEGTPRDLAMAVRYYEQATQGPFFTKPDAHFHLGQMYENGIGVSHDDRKASEYYYFAGTQFTPNYIETVRVQGTTTNSFQWVVVTNNSGALALESLLSLYVQGRGLPKDPSAVTQLLQQLQNVPNPTAREIYLLGELDYQGKIAPTNISRAVERFNQAAKNGLPEAMNRLGEMWSAGVAGAPDPKEAATWYRKAAKKGFAKAQLSLGYAYQTGGGVEQNPVEAWAWMHLAADQNLTGAREAADAVEAVLSPEQRVAATQHAARLGTDIAAQSAK